MYEGTRYDEGRKSKAAEIERDGWTAARDSFNRQYPPGLPWTGSEDLLQFSKGEYAELCRQMPGRSTY